MTTGRLRHLRVRAVVVVAAAEAGRKQRDGGRIACDDSTVPRTPCRAGDGIEIDQPRSRAESSWWARRQTRDRRRIDGVAGQVKRAHDYPPHSSSAGQHRIECFDSHDRPAGPGLPVHGRAYTLQPRSRAWTVEVSLGAQSATGTATPFMD